MTDPDSSLRNPSQLITERIAQLSDWRGKTLASLRKLVLEADPELNEAWKWGTPVWERNGLVCSAGAFEDHVKLNFLKGAAIKDPKGLFNAGLDAKTSRAIDFHEGETIDRAGIKELVRAAVAHNLVTAKKK